jgi:glycyl-tRNA synthetase beta chain
MASFLLEIGLEEIPARMVDGAREELARRVGELLLRERLASGELKMESFSTPRRLAVIAHGVAPAQADVDEQVTGPSTKVGYKDGKPTAAAEAFAKKAGVDVAQLKSVTTPKGEYLSANVTKKGRAAADVIAESFPKEIAGIYWAKNMYWRGKGSERFVRPVRWLVAMLDGQVVPLEFAGIKAGVESRGHRVLGKSDIRVQPEQYSQALEEAHVVAHGKQREQRIRKALDAQTRTVSGARWREDAALLDTVVNLTEWPSAIIGSFEREYLSLREEVLVTVMRDHQKYFAVEDANGKLAPHFLAVLNTDGDPDGLIQHGNERVLRARFNDARFFWDTDQRVPLKQRVEMLKAVTFQKDLGSYYEKTKRISAVAQKLAPQVPDVDAKWLDEAAWLCKADLTTELVKEFTELQGVVGGLYAQAQGHANRVGEAIYEHYRPESTEDAVPQTQEGALLSIIDKADSIAGMFALGMVPSGSKDPFALRRQANGIVRTVAERGIVMDVTAPVLMAYEAYRDLPVFTKFKPIDEFKNDVRAFFKERLEFFLRDVRGFAYDVVNAVLAAGSDDLVEATARPEGDTWTNVLDVIGRTDAVTSIRGSEDFLAVAAGFKRIKNILRQAQERAYRVNFTFDEHATIDSAEKQLARVAVPLTHEVGTLRQRGQNAEALSKIAELRPFLDAFFEKVMVMVENESLRANRLALLKDLFSGFSTIADFSEIVVEK